MSGASANNEIIANPLADGRGSVQKLMWIAARAEFFRSTDDRLYARVPVGTRFEIYPLRSAAFRDWLIERYFEDRCVLPLERDLRRVLGAAEAFGRFDCDTPLPICIRVGRDEKGAGHGSPYYLDLGDPSGQAIQISRDGWSVVDRPGVRFRRPEGLMALPMPRRDGSVELLRPYVNLSETGLRLLIAWIAAALRPVGPFPILTLYGEQGSAKSTLAKVVRLLIDPQSAPLLAEPRSTLDLMVTAVNGWLLAYDNISVIPLWLSDSLCRLAVGGGFASRALFSTDERSLIYAQRPVILNGIEQFVRRGDLADRGVFLSLAPIKPSKRRTEDAFWAAFHEDYPRILGGVLDAVVGGLRELPSVRLPELPRMADFAAFGEAVGRGLAWPAGTFLSAYNRNRRNATLPALEDSPVGTILLELATGKMHRRTRSPTDLLAELAAFAGKRVAASPRWPKSTQMFTNELRRLAPQLRLHRLSVKFTRTRSARLITLSRTRGPAVSSSRLTESPSHLIPSD
jgi:hypothetical protein